MEQTIENVENEHAMATTSKEAEAQVSKKGVDDIESEPINDQDRCSSSSDSDEEFFYDISPADVAECLAETRADANAAVLSGLEKLIFQQRLELARELRGLQFSDQLASGIQASRNRLEQFFSNTSSSSSSSSNAPTTSLGSVATPPAAPHRSSVLLHEIEALRSQQRVSNVLSTSRDQIERTLQVLRGGVQQRPTTNATTVNEPRLPNEPLSARPTAPPLPWLAATATHNNTTLSIEQMTREQILTDINQLVNQQLVSSLLRSEFRSRLEDRVLDRLRRAGTDGERTRLHLEQVASARRVPRNDFSHLGIVGPSDSSSSRRHADLGNARQLQEVKAELAELRTLMKMSFELQLDMQRALRQEVSALVASAVREATTTAAGGPVVAPRVHQEGHCVVCTEAPADSVFYMCGHLCACYVCSMNLKQYGHKCPVCRAPIKDIVRVYKANLE